MLSLWTEHCSGPPPVARLSWFQPDSGDDIDTGGLGLLRLDFLSGFDTLLVGPNRRCFCVSCLISDQPDFCLADHDMGRIYGADDAHVFLLEVFPKSHPTIQFFLRNSVNVRQSLNGT